MSIEAENNVHIERGPDGDRVTVNGVLIPGASLMFQDARRVVLSVPATVITTAHIAPARPHPRRIALEVK